MLFGFLFGQEGVNLLFDVGGLRVLEKIARGLEGHDLDRTLRIPAAREEDDGDILKGGVRTEHLQGLAAAKL